MGWRLLADIPTIRFLNSPAGEAEVTEGQLLELSIASIGNILHVLSVAFGLIFAYIGGLYFFLNRAPLALRLIAFGLLSIGLAFIGVVTLGIHGILIGMDGAWRDLPITATGVVSLGGERPPILGGVSFYEAGVALGFAVFGFVYIALAYLTFGYRWPER